MIQSDTFRVGTFDTLQHAETDPPEPVAAASAPVTGWPVQAEAPPPQGVVPRQPLSPAMAIVQIVLCSGLPTQLLLLWVLALVGVHAPNTTKDWSLGYVASVLVADSALVLGLILFFLHWSGEQPRQVFLGMKSIAWEWSVGIALVPLAFVMIAVINAVVQRFAPILHQPENPFQPLVQTPYGMIIFTSLSILAGGLREEMQRAFALHRFTQIGIPYTGLMVFSVIFGLGHIVQGWDAAIMTGSLGALWGYVYLRRGSIVAPAVCHGAFDAIQVIAFGLLRR